MPRLQGKEIPCTHLPGGRGRNGSTASPRKRRHPHPQSRLQSLPVARRPGGGARRAGGFPPHRCSSRPARQTLSIGSRARPGLSEPRAAGRGGPEAAPHAASGPARRRPVPWAVRAVRAPRTRPTGPGKAPRPGGGGVGNTRHG